MIQIECLNVLFHDKSNNVVIDVWVKLLHSEYISTRLDDALLDKEVIKRWHDPV